MPSFSPTSGGGGPVPPPPDDGGSGPKRNGDDPSDPKPTPAPPDVDPAPGDGPPAPEDDNDGTTLRELGQYAIEAVQHFAFPLLLALLVIVFLAVQHFLDRASPKLAFAPVHSVYDRVDFED
ncbi:MAG: hypothetical protein ACRDLB_05245 [Actinomycetota bacterium]